VAGPWRAKHAADAIKGVPAHITVLAPFAPPDVLTTDMEDHLLELFSGFPPFGFRLARVERFPLVVYLAPEPADRFTALIDAVVAEFPAYLPYGGAFDEVIPHLTVAECETGMCEDPESVLSEARRAMVGAVPIEARAHEVWLMTGNDRWSLRARFPMRGAE
jgi:2'-5' RNA ligase